MFSYSSGKNLKLISKIIERRLKIIKKMIIKYFSRSKKNVLRIFNIKNCIILFIVVGCIANLESCTPSPEEFANTDNVENNNDNSQNTQNTVAETQDDIDFREAKNQASLEAFENYLRNYPDGKYVDQASFQISVLRAVRDSIDSALDEQQAFEIAKRDNTVAGFEYFLVKFPNSPKMKDVKAILVNLKKKQTEMANAESDEKAFREARSKNTPAAYSEYLSRFPSGAHAAEANEQIQNLQNVNRQRIANEDNVYSRTETIGTIEAYEAYLREYSDGKYFQQATTMLNMLREEKRFQDAAPPNMVYVKGGDFDMGNSRGKSDEHPVRKVKVSSFYIHKFEVTNSQFALFLNAYGSDNVKSGEFAGQDMIFEEEWGLRFDGNIWSAQPGYAAFPVVNVTWFGANEFCKYYGYRLPTEAEWEYAARGGNKSRAYKYSGSNNIDTVSWYNSNSRTTRPVGKKQRNELGIYDMTGNVWEWCSDWYDKDYYQKNVINNPTGPSSGTAKVLRGGSFFDNRDKLSPTARDFSFPFIGYYSYGFRCVKSIP